MPKDHGRRLWCDSGTCRFSEPLTSKSLMPLSSVIHWLHLCSFPFLSMASFWRWIAMHMLAQCLPGVAKSGTDVLETGTSCSQHKVLAAKVGPDLFQICSVGQPPDQNWSHEAEGTPLSRHGRLWNIVKHPLVRSRHLILVIIHAAFPKASCTLCHGLHSWFCSACSRNSKARGRILWRIYHDLQLYSIYIYDHIICIRIYFTMIYNVWYKHIWSIL